MALAITGSLALGETSPSAYNPRFGYKNLLLDGNSTVTVSSEKSDFPKEQAFDGFTDTAWVGEDGSGPWTIELQLSGARADFLGLLLFGDTPNNAPDGVTITLQFSNDGGETWGNVADPIQVTSRVVGIIFDSEQHDRWRVKFEGGTEAPLVADVTLCQLLIGEYAITQPFEPPVQARNNEIMSNETDTGHFVGRSVIRKGIKTKVSISSCSEDWVREKWEPFVDHAEVKPFYLVWNPARWPKEIAFVWADGSIDTPKYTSNVGWMDVGLPVKGFA